MKNSPEQFNPANQRYKRVEDLPKNQRGKFKNVENGFIGEKAIANPQKAEEIARTRRVQKGYEQILEFKKKGLYREAQILLEGLEKDIDIMDKG